MNFQMCLQRHTSAACGTSVLQPLKADRKYPHYWSVADYSYIHSIICSSTCLFIHSFTLQNSCLIWKKSVLCLHRGNEGVLCGKLLWFEITYGSQPKCWNSEPRWLSSCTWPDRAVHVCVLWLHLMIMPVLAGAVGAIVPRPLYGLLTVMATQPWPHSLNGSVYDMMSPVWASYCLTPAHVAFSPQTHSLSVTYTLRGKEKEIGAGLACFTMLSILLLESRLLNNLQHFNAIFFYSSSCCSKNVWFSLIRILKNVLPDLFRYICYITSLHKSYKHCVRTRQIFTENLNICPSSYWHIHDDVWVMAMSEL